MELEKLLKFHMHGKLVNMDCTITQSNEEEEEGDRSEE